MSSYNTDNIFRKIIDGAIPSYKVFETEHTLAILDAFPAVRGHCLLLPKGNFVNAEDISPEASAELFRQLPRLVNAVKEATGADAVNVFSNVGEAAGQVVMHMHVHVVPRFAGDQLFKLPASAREMIKEDEAKDLLSSLQSKL